MPLACILVLLGVWSNVAVAVERIVSVDGALTEIVHGLGIEAQLVGVDTTSQYPPKTVKDLPKVGYKRSLSAEGILALQPDLVLATDDAGPPEVMRQLQAVNVKIEFIPDEPTVPGLHAKVRAVARVLGRVPQGEQLIKRINADLAEARQIVQRVRDKPRILFLLHIGSGADMSGGRDTVADAMITLAGGVNVMGQAFTGYKPITSEAVVAAEPEIVLLTRRNLVSLGSTSLAFLTTWLGAFSLPVAAFVGSLITTIVVYRLATEAGRTVVTTMLLAGIAINALVGAGIGLFTFLADDEQLRTLTFWNLGSLSGVTWSTLAAAALLIILPLLFIPRLARGLNVFVLGESEAEHLGFNTDRIKRQVVICVALAVGAAVAVSGVIGFIGLVVPHLVRLTLGPDHRYLLPGSMLLGASLLLGADLLSRTLVAPAELPIGIITALIGGPFFLGLLLHQRRTSYW